MQNTRFWKVIRFIASITPVFMLLGSILLLITKIMEAFVIEYMSNGALKTLIVMMVLFTIVNVPIGFIVSQISDTFKPRYVLKQLLRCRVITLHYIVILSIMPVYSNYIVAEMICSCNRIVNTFDGVMAILFKLMLPPLLIVELCYLIPLVVDTDNINPVTLDDVNNN